MINSTQRYCRVTNGQETGVGGNVAQLVERAPLTQVRFLGAAKDFSPVVQFQCRLSYGVRTTPCAIACIDICAHGKHPAVHVTVRWIMKTLKHPACTVGWVVQLCRSRLSPKKQPVFPMGEKVKSKKKRRVKCKSKKKVERNSAEPLNKPPQTILYRRSE